MTVAYLMSLTGLGALMQAPAVFRVSASWRFGFLGMGAGDHRRGLVRAGDRQARSPVYELSMIETLPNIGQEIKKEFGFTPNFAVAKEILEENDGAGNTFKATAKPVLIGTGRRPARRR